MREENFLRGWLKEGKVSLTERLLKVVDDYEIYQSLIGEDIDLGETINSPIRSSDNFPSFTVFIPVKLIERGYDIRPDELWFKDLADSRFGNVFTFCKHYAKYQFGEILESRYDIIKFIDRQLELGLFSDAGPSKVATKRNYEKRELKDILYKSRQFTENDLAYWDILGIEEEDLKHFNVKSVKYLINERGEVRKRFKYNELAFVYEIWDKCKLYQPKAPRSFKFRNICPGDDYRYYQGYQQLTGEPDTLIITKSMKDLMVFWKFYNKVLGIPVDVLAPHAESINLSPIFVGKVKKLYKRIICVSDFDLAGIKFAKQCRDHGFEYKFVSTTRGWVEDQYKVIDKDLSDFLTRHGRGKTIKLLNSWEIKP